MSESAAAGRADAPPPAAPQPLSREAGVDYGDAAPRDADGNLVDLSNDLNFGVRASSPYDRGEPFNDEDYVYETDEWSIGHGANGSFEVDGRGRTSAYLPVLAGGAKSPKVTSMARWRIDCYDEAKAGRIWRNRGVISRLIKASDPGSAMPCESYLRVEFHDDGTMTVAGSGGAVYAERHPAAP